MRYSTIDDPNSSQLRSIRIDRHWFPARQCQRDDQAGYWQCTDLAERGPGCRRRRRPRRSCRTWMTRARASRPVAGVHHLQHAVCDLRRDRALLPRHRPDHRCAARAGDHRSQHGAGIARRRAPDLRRHDRDSGQSRVRASAAQPGRDSIRPEAHRRNAGARSDARHQRAQARQTINVVGMDGSGSCRRAPPTIADVDPLLLPLSRTVRFRDSNLKVASLVNPPDDFVGVLSDDDGRVRGLWASFASDNGRELVQENRGIPSDLVAETLDIVRAGRPLHSLEAEFVPQTLADARQLGLSAMRGCKRISQATLGARGAERRAAGGRLGRRAPAAAGRYAAGDRRQAGDAVSRGRARRSPMQEQVAVTRLARQRRADPAGADRERSTGTRSTAWSNGRARRCRRPIAP